MAQSLKLIYVCFVYTQKLVMNSEKYGRKWLKRANKNRQYSSTGTILFNWSQFRTCTIRDSEWKFDHWFIHESTVICPLLEIFLFCKTISSMVLVLVAYIILQSVEWFIEDKAFSPAYDFNGYTPSPSRQQVVSLSLSCLPVCVRLSFWQCEGGRSQIILRRESLVLCKSFTTLWIITVR